MRPRSVDVLQDGSAVRITWPDGTSARFHALWLRDNAPDGQTRGLGNGQRLVTILDIPAATTIAAAALDPAGDVALTFAPDGHRTAFRADWLRAHVYDKPAPAERGWVSPEVALWDGRLRSSVPGASYGEVRNSPAALRDWLAGVRRYGFARLEGVPRHCGGVADIAALFGFVRETNYGRWFDVRAKVDPDNLADTSLGLQAHTDNPYCDPVPTLQLLCCLENSVEGGDSAVVDGFMAAARLRESSPDSFDLLARYPARFEYAGAAGTRLRAKRPLIELGPDGEMIAVRFNNRSAAAFVDVAFDAMAAFYAAYRRFAEIIEGHGMAVRFKLEPGQAFIVDNTRVLHARTSFAGSGTRWLQGCYADKDGLLSTLAALDDQTGRIAVA